MQLNPGTQELGPFGGIMIHIPMLLSASALLAPLAPTPVARMAAPVMQLNPGTQEMMYRQSMRNMDVRGAIAPTGAGLDHQIVNVQGGSLKTWSFPSPMQDQAHIILSSDGNPSIQRSTSGTDPTTL